MDDRTTTADMDEKQQQEKTKFCKHCARKIPEAAVVCVHCGCQVEDIKKSEQPSIVINNSNTNTNTNVNANTNNNSNAPRAKEKNKWVAFVLCLLLGYFGAHKFYEGKTGMGIVYLCTGGICAVGWLIDCVVLLCKPTPYYV